MNTCKLLRLAIAAFVLVLRSRHLTVAERNDTPAREIRRHYNLRVRVERVPWVD